MDDQRRAEIPYELGLWEVKRRLERLHDALARQQLQDIVLDDYENRREGDLEQGKGFLNSDEVKEFYSSPSLEVTFANADRRNRFFNTTDKDFVRTKTIIGRRLEYCHPPRLENYVRMHVRDQESELESKTFWTGM